jgi:hypothetical protein
MWLGCREGEAGEGDSWTVKVSVTQGTLYCYSSMCFRSIHS